MQEERICNILPAPSSIPGSSDGWNGRTQHLHSLPWAVQGVGLEKTSVFQLLRRRCIMISASEGDGGREGTTWVEWEMDYIIKHVNLFFQSFFAGACESEECGCGLGLWGWPVLCFFTEDVACDFSRSWESIHLVPDLQEILPCCLQNCKKLFTCCVFSF